MKKLFVFLLLILLAVPATAEETVEIPQVKEVYEIGEEDDSIISVKLRLQELNYYESNLTNFSGKYNRYFVRIVKLFQSCNQIPSTGKLDNLTMQTMFSDSAMSESEFIALYKKDVTLEPDNALILANSANYGLENRYLSFTVKVENTSSKRRVYAFEISYIPYDPWNTPMVLPDTVYTINTIASIDPGKTKSANTIYLENGNDIFELWAGVSKVRYEDGTVVIIPYEEIVWDYWGPFLSQNK